MDTNITTSKVIIGGIVCLVWVMSTACHEFSHAIVAYWGGDKSVKDRGYLTLNPFAYTNTGTTLVLPAVFLLLGGFALPGAAVYIRRGSLRNRFWQSAVSAAGPFATLLVTVLLAFAFSIARNSGRDSLTIQIIAALAMLVYFHSACFLLNVLPVPGLDGYGCIEPWLPNGIRAAAARLGNAGFAIVLLLMWMPIPNEMLWSTAGMISTTLGVPGELGEIGFLAFRGVITGWAILMIITLYFFRKKEKVETAAGTTARTPVKADEQARIEGHENRDGKEQEIERRTEQELIKESDEGNN